MRFRYDARRPYTNNSSVRPDCLDGVAANPPVQLTCSLRQLHTRLPFMDGGSLALLLTAIISR